MPREENKMGKWGATSYIIGNIVGSGIFITPTSILLNTSSVGLSLLVWTLSAVISALGAYCYVELGTSIRKSGGDFAYLCYVKWPAIAFVFMSAGCVLTFPLTLAIQVETFSEYIIQGFGFNFCDDWAIYFFRKFLGFSIVWIMLFLNFFSLGTAVSRFQIACTIAKIVSIGLIIVTGFYLLLFQGQTQNLREPFANSTLEPGKIVNAFFAGLFSYDGWDILNFGAEDIENPKRTMPFAIIVGIASVAMLYLAINFSYFIVLTIPQIESSVAVATTFAQSAMGNFYYGIPFLITILLIGSLNSTLFAASRYLYAASRERHFPAFIGCVNEQNDSPRAALFAHVMFAIIFSFLGNIEDLINYVAFAMWMQRTFTMAALLYIRITHKPIHPEAIRTPLILPIFFMFICLALCFVTMYANFKTTAVGMIMLGVGLFTYIFFVWDKMFNKLPWYRHLTFRINDRLSVMAQIAFNGVIKLEDSSESQLESRDEDYLSSEKSGDESYELAADELAESASLKKRSKNNKNYKTGSTTN